MLARILKQAPAALCALALASTCLPALAGQRIQSGHWAIVGEEGLGSGININLQDGADGTVRVGLTVFTYGDNGQPTWYLATGTLDSGGNLIVARLITARDGQPLEQSFSPAQSVDTGRDIRITFTGGTSGEVTLDGVTKSIRLLRFAGDSVTIPGDAAPGTITTIPDLSGEWMFVVRPPGQVTQTRLLRLAPLSTLPPVGGDIPDAPVIYAHQDNPLSRAFFYCDIETFDGLNLRVPLCYLRLVENERITEYTVPTENIGPQRFDAALVTIPEEQAPEVFALRLGDLE